MPGYKVMVRVVYYDRRQPGYPPGLLKLERMPAGLYVAGRLPDPARKSVAIVGARACSDYGRRETARFARALAEHGVQIISGLAYGIDAWAHRGALEAGGNTFAVLGSGADVCYPRANYSLYRRMIREGGGVLSEFEPGTQPVPWHFPIRNRIISGLSDLVLVVEARKKSGALITADYALEQGKSVYAVPGRLDDPLSEGCNRLIAQGAAPACEPEQLLEEMGIFRREKRRAGETGDGKRAGAAPEEKNLKEDLRPLYDRLRRGPAGLAELRETLGWETGRLSAAIVDLQLKGLIEEFQPGLYRRARS